MKRSLTMDALSNDSDAEFSRLCLNPPPQHHSKCMYRSVSDVGRELSRAWRVAACAVAGAMVADLQEVCRAKVRGSE